MAAAKKTGTSKKTTSEKAAGASKSAPAPASAMFDKSDKPEKESPAKLGEAPTTENADEQPVEAAAADAKGDLDTGQVPAQADTPPENEAAPASESTEAKAETETETETAKVDADANVSANSDDKTAEPPFELVRLGGATGVLRLMPMGRVDELLSECQGRIALLQGNNQIGNVQARLRGNDGEAFPLILSYPDDRESDADDDLDDTTLFANLDTVAALKNMDIETVPVVAVRRSDCPQVQSWCQARRQRKVDDTHGDRLDRMANFASSETEEDSAA